MAGFVGDGYDIEMRWKEEVIYWEGDRGVLFGAAWGVEPPVLFVPSPQIWHDSMPDWLRDRRDEVLERLRDHGDHVLAEEWNEYYRNHPDKRVVGR
jgi:hypothetical protein